MRILFAANRSEVFSGGEISLLELISRMSKGRFEPVLACPGEGSLAASARVLGISVEICDMPSIRTFDLARVLRSAAVIREVIRKYGIEVVHSNGMRAQFYSSLAVRGTASALLWHVRESARDIPLYENYLAGRADLIVCVSEGVKAAHFGRSGRLEDKIRVVYNGVDTGAFFKDEDGRNNVRKELGIAPAQKVIGITGLIVPLKGHDVLLNAFKLIKDKYPEALLLITGKAVESKYAENIEKMMDDPGLKGRVIMPGQRCDMRAVLSALDIFVLPSSREGFSRALLEAMACSLPIIVSDVPGNNEAVNDGESGMLVPYGDETLLARALRTLLGDAGAARRMGENARERAVRLFGIEKHVSVIESLYARLGK